MHILLHMAVLKEMKHLLWNISIIYERSKLAIINPQTSVCSLPSWLPSYQLCLSPSWGTLICMRPADFCIWATLLSPCCIPLAKVSKRDSRDARFSRLSWIQLPLTQGKFLLHLRPQMLQIWRHASTSGSTPAQVHHTAQSGSLQIKPQAKKRTISSTNEVINWLFHTAFNRLEFSVNTSWGKKTKHCVSTLPHECRIRLLWRHLLWSICLHKGPALRTIFLSQRWR